MKIFVSTNITQGRRHNDFCFVPDGEIVRFGFECDREAVDGKCGCRRSLCGINSQTATTTFKVIESTLSEKEYTDQIINSEIEAGWAPRDSGEEDFKDWCKGVEGDAKELLRLASMFKAGAVLERRGNTLRQRVV